MPTEIIAITGRFQPFHRDHLELVRYGLTRAGQLLIGITNPDRRSLKPTPSSSHRHLRSSNPFTYTERARMISAALETDGIDRQKYELVPFPLDAPGAWPDYIPFTALQLVRVYSEWEKDKAGLLRAGGYDVEVLIGDAGTRISATDIRAAMAAGRPWQHWVPEGAAGLLAGLGVDTLRHRCTRADVAI